MTNNIQVASAGCLRRVIEFLANGYLIFMVFYLVYRFVIGADNWWVSLFNATVIYTFSPLVILISLTILVGSWRAAGRLFVLGLVGVFWFGPFFQPQSVQPATDQTIQVATLHVGNNHTEPQTILTWINNTSADVVLLQAVPPAFAATLIAGVTTTVYEDSGNMIFVWKPVTDFEALGTRIHRVKIMVDGKPLAVYNIHFSDPFNGSPRLDAPILDELSRYDETIRNAEIDILLDILEDETLPFIVAGNFNLSQHSIKYSDLVVNMKDSFRETNSGLGATWSTDMLFPALRLDYIFYSDRGLRAVETNMGSDVQSSHLPFIAKLEIQ